MEITVGELIDQLRLHPRSAKVYFSGLDFYRVKERAPDLVQIEFNQLIERDGKGHIYIVDSPE